MIPDTHFILKTAWKNLFYKYFPASLLENIV